MAMIKCGECGKSVSDQAFVCPNCGRDVRALKVSGYGCGNCSYEGDSDSGYCSYGPSGYPCLMHSYIDWDSD